MRIDPPRDDAPPFSLLETMRLEHGQVLRADRHIARMWKSADYFGYPWNAPAVSGHLGAAAHEHGTGVWRLRLLLDANGALSVTCTPHVDDPRRRWRVGFAPQPIDNSSAFLYNKTTNRDVYDAARRACPDADDVLLWNARGEITESTVANVVVERGGVKLTPPVESGLLPGVLRAELLDRGDIVERVITKSDIVEASRCWLINSLRGWIPIDVT